MSQPLAIKRTGRVGRKRRTAGWTLLTLGVLVAAVWIWSAWWSAHVQSGNLGLSISDGEMWIALTDQYQGPSIQVESRRGPCVNMWLGWWSNPQLTMKTAFDGAIHATPGHARWAVYVNDWPPRHVTLLLWPIPLLLWTPAALLLRWGILARRRAMTNTCTKCGYLLAGITPGSACPECGTKSKAGAPQSTQRAQRKAMEEPRIDTHSHGSESS